MELLSEKTAKDGYARINAPSRKHQKKNQKGNQEEIRGRTTKSQMRNYIESPGVCQYQSFARFSTSSGLILVYQKCTRLKPQKSKRALLPVGYLSQGIPRDLRNPKLWK